MTHRIFAFTLAICFACCSLCLGQSLIGVDFNLDAGASPFNWNSLSASNSAPGSTPTPMTIIDLIDETGALTGISYSLDSSVGTIRAFNANPVSGTIPMHSNPLGLIGDYFHNDTADDDLVTSTFSGLGSGVDYDIWVFGLRAQEYENIITITGADAPITFSQAGKGTQLSINSQLGDSSLDLSDYAITVRSTFDGQINIDWTEGSLGDRYAVAGVAIRPSAIPEPSTGLILVVVVVGCSIRTRRK